MFNLSPADLQGREVGEFAKIWFVEQIFYSNDDLRSGCQSISPYYLKLAAKHFLPCNTHFSSNCNLLYILCVNLLSI